MTAVKRSLNVGFVGLGNMGLPMARNLAFKGRSSLYLQLHSRTMSRTRRVSDDLGVDGATCAMRLHDRYSTITKWCDVIFLALADAAAAESVLLAHAEALLPHARPGQIIVDHTTVPVALSRACARAAARRGAVFLDAPMSGSPRAAFNNQLVFTVGGDKEAFQKVLPLLRMSGEAAHHMGGSGAGSAAKLLSQALVASHNAAAAEAMTMAARLGIEDRAALLQVLDAGWGSSTMLRRNAPLMEELLRNPDRLPRVSGASVDRLLADLAMLDASLARSGDGDGDGGDGGGHYGSSDSAGEEEEEEFPVLDASLRMLGAAQEAGQGDRDMSAVVNFIQAAAVMTREAAERGAEGPTGGEVKEEMEKKEEKAKGKGGEEAKSQEFTFEDFY